MEVAYNNEKGEKSMRQVITIPTHYMPIQWGVKMVGNGMLVWALYKRTDSEEAYNLAYGDDADTYRAFEEEGFTRTKKVADRAEAEQWLNINVYNI